MNEYLKVRKEIIIIQTSNAVPTIIEVFGNQYSILPKSQRKIQKGLHNHSKGGTLNNWEDKPSGN